MYRVIGCKRWLVVWVATLVAVGVLALPVSAGTISFQTVAMADQTTSGTTTLAYADAGLTVYFEAAATCNCECEQSLTYT